MPPVEIHNPFVPRGDEYAGAVFSTDMRHRYLLWRIWNIGGPTLLWIMLNPSTADENDLDPTLKRVFSFTRTWGYAGFRIVNAYAFRATKPAIMLDTPDRVGPHNDVVLSDEIDRASKVIVGWGRNIELDREADLCRMFTEKQCATYCLGRVHGGHPIHPLYLPGATILREWP